MQIQSRVAKKTEFPRHSRHSARNHFASKCCNNLKCDWLLTGYISPRLSSTAFSNDSLRTLLLNYPSYGLKYTTLQRAVSGIGWGKATPFLWYLKSKHAVIVESKSVNHTSILSNQLSGVRMPLRLVMPAQQWRAHDPACNHSHQPSLSPPQLCNLTFSGITEFQLLEMLPKPERPYLWRNVSQKKKKKKNGEKTWWFRNTSRSILMVGQF